ncbi:hypothetical protein DQ04_01971070 [Trypanosoma grayi]|uniref:hypothetical protein n=1 Tax=Trypanosoma grayi TaxID=71804 RepID=UPI0004F43ECE|nr:hypothetical protein DQ04_01971070 [Trypanosoma grayi]KEG12135.1 hypothetical protein DQ04_01971070 [Trypanosoma grayi]
MMEGKDNMPPPAPLAVKEAPTPTPPPPAAGRSYILPSLLWEDKQLVGRAAPDISSAVAMSAATLSGPCSPAEPGKVAAVGNDDTGGMTIFPVCADGKYGQRHPFQEQVNARSSSSEGEDDVRRNHSDNIPNSPAVVGENLLRLLQHLPDSGDGAPCRTCVSSGAGVVEDDGCDIELVKNGEEESLDDLFMYLLSVLEQVVEDFLSRSLHREWKARGPGKGSTQLSPAKEAAQLWSLAWCQADHRDKEAWLAWKSAIYRSWRRTKRECDSRERSEALNIALFQLDPSSTISARYTMNASRHKAEQSQAERHRALRKLHALVYRVLCTCPALLLDEHTQQLAATTSLNLDAVCQWIRAPTDDDDDKGDVAAYIRGLCRCEEDPACSADFTNIEELEGLFASARRALLGRFDAGEKPPSSLMVAPLSSPLPQPFAVVHTPGSPEPRFTTPTTQLLPASVPRYVDPTMMEPRSLGVTASSWSPSARAPDSARKRASMSSVVLPDDAMAFLLSSARVGHDTPKLGRVGRTNVCSLARQQEELKDTSIVLSPQERNADSARPVRYLPSALRTPRSVSSR